MKLTLGSDPELMVLDHRKNRIVSSLEVLDGRDKTDPIKLSGGIKLYADNVLAEIAHPPVNSVKDAVDAYRDIFTKVGTFLGTRYSLVPHAAHVYHKDEMRDPRALKGGCNPSLDAYKEAENPMVKFTNNLRTGSFHIHIGYDKLESMPMKVKAVRILDMYLGCASVIFDRDPTAKTRRSLYGRAGEFRATEYGLEYRVLGNYALRTPGLTELAFELAHYSMKKIDHNADAFLMREVNPIDVQRAINECDRNLSARILHKIGLPIYLWAMLERYKDIDQPAELAWNLGRK